MVAGHETCQSESDVFWKAMEMAESAESLELLQVKAEEKVEDAEAGGCFAIFLFLLLFFLVIETFSGDRRILLFCLFVWWKIFLGDFFPNDFFCRRNEEQK